MKISLSFESVQEFSLFICSTAALEFMLLSDVGVRLGRYLPRESYRTFLEKLVEVRVGDVVYEVRHGYHHPGSVEFTVQNWMLNDVQVESDHILISFPDEHTVVGSEKVREHLETLPASFILMSGWRTDHHVSAFIRR